MTPVVWAVLGWVRRNLFNQSPTITYNPTTSVQTGQTVTGNIGATDPEGDALTYKVTQAPQHGTLTIDQATGNFTYTPDDINYDAAQLDSFTVSVTDGKFNLLSLFSPHSDQETIEVTTLNPTVERVILNMPAGDHEAGQSALLGRRKIHLLLRHTGRRRSRRDLSDRHRRDGREVPHLRPRRPNSCGDGPRVADQHSETRSVLRRDRASRGAPEQSGSSLCDL